VRFGAAMRQVLFEELHRQEEGRLKRFFTRRLRNQDDALDATQETFARWLGLSPKTRIENPQAYLFKIANSVACRNGARLHADRQMMTTEHELDQFAEDAPCQERIVAAREYLMIMARAIESLPARCQEVFIFSRLHGLANGDIAQRLGISRNMVEKHIMRALITCRAVRAKLAVEEPDAALLSGPVDGRAAR